jgi:tRNA G18 (ribose-2'-O)-methylase SpoU
MNQNKFVVILPNIRSAHNVGAIFRTADGAGVDKLYLTGYTACPPHTQLDKVSLGAEKWVPWEHCKQTIPLLKKLKKAGFTIAALEKTKKSVSIYEWQSHFPLALVVGNEKTGVTPAMLKYCDMVLHLPMRGQKTSLNVSVAGGIALYQLAQKLHS